MLSNFNSARHWASYAVQLNRPPHTVVSARCDALNDAENWYGFVWWPETVRTSLPPLPSVFVGFFFHFNVMPSTGLFTMYFWASLLDPGQSIFMGFPAYLNTKYNAHNCYVNTALNWFDNNCNMNWWKGRTCFWAREMQTLLLPWKNE